MLVKQHIPFILHKPTPRRTNINSLPKRRLIKQIMLPHKLLDILCCFLRVIKWHRREQMVNYMSISDMMEEYIEEAKVTVDCSQGALEEIPLVVVVVWYDRICVLQVCD